MKFWEVIRHRAVVLEMLNKIIKNEERIMQAVTDLQNAITTMQTDVAAVAALVKTLQGQITTLQQQVTDDTVDPALIESMATTVNTADAALEAIVNPAPPQLHGSNTVI